MLIRLSCTTSRASLIEMSQYSELKTVHHSTKDDMPVVIPLLESVATEWFYLNWFDRL